MSLIAEAAPSGSTIGAGLIAAALKHAGVNFMFGVVGIPIIEVRRGRAQ
jgi:thiamine pyrophosphate-dependent acetolactate synthase large subunit-like protein